MRYASSILPGYLVVTFLHLTGLYLFTSGFLLRRVTLPNIAHISQNDVSVRPKIIWLIIDALREDFVFNNTAFSTPARLVKTQPNNTFMARFVADPPTTTLQRIKGLTTGSLPTFIDMSANFAAGKGAEGTVGEDNLLNQMSRHGVRVGFVGDDTWIGAFQSQNVWAPEMTWGFDSFDVADLDTVDYSVGEKLRWFLHPEQGLGKWDVVIAHTLGIDHVGHTYGPGHEEMKRKLTEMNDLVDEVVGKMDEDTVFIVCGDHGMDRRGDHGGDSELELNAGIWIHSKRPLHHDTLIPAVTTDTGRRTVRQIDIVPTIAHLLGMSIPFNSLGFPILELFHPDRQPEVVQSTACQIATYMRTLKQAGILDIGFPLPEVLDILSGAEKLYSNDAFQEALPAFYRFSRLTLESLQSVWAQFDLPLIFGGILLLFMSIMVNWRLLSIQEGNNTIFHTVEVSTFWAFSAGSVLTTALYLFDITSQTRGGIFGIGIFNFALCFAMGILFYTKDQKCKAALGRSSAGLILPILHAAVFASNSFTVWEDKIILFLFQSGLVYMIIQSFTIPDAQIRLRSWTFIGATLFSARSLSYFTICREEQAPFCRNTFYNDSQHEGTSLTPVFVLIFLGTILFFVSSTIQHILGVGNFPKNPAQLWLHWGCQFVLFAGVFYWGYDEILGRYPTWKNLLLSIDTYRNWAACIALCLPIIGGFLVSVSNLFFTQIDDIPNMSGMKSHKTIILFGSSYSFFLTLIWAPLVLVSLPTSQLSLMVGFPLLLVFLRAFDLWRKGLALRDLKGGGVVRPEPLPIFQISILALYGYVLYFTTGHQATLSSIQWKSAFVGLGSITYPFSPFLVIFNTLGPFVITAMAAPLVSIWNIIISSWSSDFNSQRRRTINLINYSALTFTLYHTIITLSSMVFATHFRRHLMVWKIFAPRFMLGGITLLAVDFGVTLLGMTWAVPNLLHKFEKISGGMNAINSN